MGYRMKDAERLTAAIQAANGGVVPDEVEQQKTQALTKLAGWKLAGWTW